ncbi:MAG TPA: Calx-beta domain-containing protein, partial [Vicinamibacteria bacterium]|nr:Calx-beta domain-containing protein [Vicinamibacteria bacterium]
GGIVEYSTNGGASWSNASALLTAGASYGGTLSSSYSNPLAGNMAFVKDSFGYTASQYSLSSLSGQSSVRFRFRMGTDNSPGYDDYGWFIDDFRVYTCAAVGVSINDTAVVEGNAGFVNANLTVSLGGPLGSTMTVNYATADGTAIAGSDYTATSGTLTFLPGETAKNILVPVAGDTVGEPAETFFVNLSGSTGASIVDGQGQATILNDDSTAVLSVSPKSVFEGDPAATFTVSMTGVPIGTVTVNYATSDGSAAAGSDYTTTSGTLTFTLGQTSKTLSVPILDDGAVEGDETFTVTLSGITGGTLGTAAANGTILNDDFAGPGAWTPTSLTSPPPGRDRPSMVWTGTRALVWGGSDGAGGYPAGGIFDPTANSWAVMPNTGAPPSGRSGQTAVWAGSRMIVWGGNDGVANLNTGASFNPATNAWTSIGTSGAPSARTNHTAVWTGSKMIVWGGYDGAANLNTGGVYDPATNTWTSVTTTGAPTGRSWHTAVWNGTRMLVWGGFDTLGAVTATGAAYDPATNTWTSISTVGAPAGRYVHTAVWTGSRMIVWGGYNPATLAFLSTGGAYNSATDTWTPVTNTGAPAARWFHTAVWTGSHMIVWGGRQGASNFATGGLYDPIGDTWQNVPTAAAPTRRYQHGSLWTGTQMLTWGGFDGARPTSGGLYQPPAPTVTTDPATAVTDTEATWNGTVNPNGLATDAYFEYGLDTTYGSATTPSSAGSGSVPVPVTFAATGLLCGRTYHYRVVASNSLGTASGLDVSFATSPCPPTLSISDVSVVEGDAGTTNATFTVTLSAASASTVTVSAETSDVTATAGSDYTATGPTTLSFAPGVLTQTFIVPVLTDTTDEPNETATVTLSSPTNAVILDGFGTLSVVNDDGAASFSVFDAAISEGYLSGSTMTFPVRLSAPLGVPASVDYATSNGTALAGTDYTTAAGTLTFNPGEVVKFATVPVLGDAAAEPNETLTLTLSNASGAAMLDDTGTGTILNDDGATISVTDYAIAEGTGAGVTNLAFTVITSQTSILPITVTYSTMDGTAAAPSDYATTSGTLTIPPGAASVALLVPVVRDAVVESNETVLLNLTAATNATLFRSQGTGTIQADDGLLVSIADKTTSEGNAGFTPIHFTVTLSAPAPGAVNVDYATADGTALATADYAASSGTVSFA